MPARELLRRPDARAESVEDLVAMVLRGEVRIPVFQRPLNWDVADVVALFDSIYRGYPIGSLLLRRAAAAAGPFQLGPLQLFGEETTHALWVVDGQQRLTSLAAGLGRQDAPSSKPVSTDPYAIFFDPATEVFSGPRADGQIPSTWVPVPRLLSASDLSEWVFTAWAHGKDAELRAIVFEAGKRLRDYKVPIYIIETPDEQVARLIFDRVNTSGKQLEREDVFNALFGHTAGVPSTLQELAQDLERLGMGSPDEESQVLPSLVALRGFDVTRRFSELAHEHPDAFAGITVEAAPILRTVLGFLRTHAEIPHLRLLPYSAPIVVLTRFFAKHREPSPRTETLLVRWTWRTFLAPTLDDRTLRRRGVAAIDDDEEGSAQALLALVDSVQRAGFGMPDRFDARAAATRLVFLGLAAQQPRLAPAADGATTMLDVAGAVRDFDRDAFRQIFPGSGGALSSPANRLLLPGPGSARAALVGLLEADGDALPFFHSHLIDGDAARALVDGDAERFVALRKAVIEKAVDTHADRLAEWGRSDRPSIEYLLRLGDEP
ncbi:MAG: DUF262 domain-containing protein [Myxococcales bacterium]|nr:DUF262 domain-containing protein [Myxococcales bacterium]